MSAMCGQDYNAHGGAMCAGELNHLDAAEVFGTPHPDILNQHLVLAGGNQAFGVAYLDSGVDPKSNVREVFLQCRTDRLFIIHNQQVKCFGRFRSISFLMAGEPATELPGDASQGFETSRIKRGWLYIHVVGGVAFGVRWLDTALIRSRVGIQSVTALPHSSSSFSEKTIKCWEPANNGASCQFDLAGSCQNWGRQKQCLTLLVQLGSFQSTPSSISNRYLK